MTNFKGNGYRLNYNNSGSAIASGDVVVLQSGGTAGGINVGIAVDAIAATTGTGTVQIAGVFNLTGTAGQTGAIGDAAYWSGTAVTTSSTGNTWCGVFAKAKVSADTTVDILLNGKPSFM